MVFVFFLHSVVLPYWYCSLGLLLNLHKGNILPLFLSLARVLSLSFSLSRALSLSFHFLSSLSPLSLSHSLSLARAVARAVALAVALSLSLVLSLILQAAPFSADPPAPHTRKISKSRSYILHMCAVLRYIFASPLSHPTLHLLSHTLPYISSLTPYPTSPLSHPALHLLSHTLPYISSLTPYPTSPLSHPTLPLLSHTLPYISSLTPYPTSPLSYPILRIHTHERPQSHSRQSVLQRHNILHVCAVLHYIFRVSSLTPYPTYPHTRKISKSRSTVRITKTYF